jgi:hypothetical protein
LLGAILTTFVSGVSDIGQFLTLRKLLSFESILIILDFAGIEIGFYPSPIDHQCGLG